MALLRRTPALLLSIPLTALLLSGASARASLLAYEPFTNAPGVNIIGSSDGFGFNGAWQVNSSSGVATNTAYALTYTDGAGNTLVTAGGAGFFQGLTSANNNMQPIRLFNFSRGTNGTDGVTTWISLLAVRQGPTVAGNNPCPRGANVPHDLNTGAIQKLAIGNSSGAPTNTVGLIPLGNAANLKASTRLFSVTNFIVVRIDHVAGAANDNAWLFVNPSLSTQPSTSAADTNSLASFDFSFDRLRVFAGGNASAAQPYAELVVDEYRIGDTYADVAPYTPPFVATGPLTITNAFLLPGNIVLAGTGGSNNATYELLANASPATPSAAWPVAASNQFDANGNFILTNPLPPGSPEQYYRIRIPAPLPPVGPSIQDPPVSLVVTQGNTAAFSVTASGTAPLSYQWFFNTNSPLSGANASNLTILNAQSTNAGGYSVRVSNVAGSATSSVVTLTVLVPVSITTPPQSQSVLLTSNATFTVTAAGIPTPTYQWYFNTNTLLPGEIASSLTIVNVQSNNAGGYSVVVSNSINVVTSSVATLTVLVASTNPPDFSLFGFGAPAAGGGTLPETDPNYRKVFTPGDLRLALANNNTKIIEIMNDLNLGWNEIGATNQTGAFRQSTAPSLHPVLIASGITTVDIQNKNGLTIFSTNGSTIRHGEFNVKRTHNVLIRNLRFDELWEWDEADKGDYDSKDWDFITIGDAGQCTNVWIDHCDFTKAYDGVVDIKGGFNNVTISWCRFLADDGGPSSFVRRQIVNLETNGVPEAMYDFLRTHGFGVEDIIAITRSQKKGHLAGATEKDPDNAGIKLTLHHNYYFNFQDRMPRLRAGNSHVYNVYANNTEARAAKNLRNAIIAGGGSVGTFKFDVTLNGAISTEDGAVLVEKCNIVDTTSPLRNNQTDPSDPTFTGKIRAEDTIYTSNGSTFRGNTEDPGSPLVPVPATLKPFSWNGFVSLPYSYTPDDPSTIAATIQTYSGAGVINWAKTNWFRTTY